MSIPFLCIFESSAKMGLALPAPELSKLEISSFSELKFLLEKSQIPYKFRKIRGFSGLKHMDICFLYYWSFVQNLLKGYATSGSFVVNMSQISFFIQGITGKAALWRGTKTVLDAIEVVPDKFNLSISLPLSLIPIPWIHLMPSNILSDTRQNPWPRAG